MPSIDLEVEFANPSVAFHGAGWGFHLRLRVYSKRLPQRPHERLSDATVVGFDRGGRGKWEPLTSASWHHTAVRNAVNACGDLGTQHALRPTASPRVRVF